MTPDPKTAPDDPSRVEEPAAAYKASPEDPVIAGVRAARRLRDAGFDRQQADAVVLAVRELVGELATKTDLAIVESELRAEIAEVKADLKLVKKDVEHIKGIMATSMATKADIVGMATKADVLGAEKRLITWFVSTALVFAGTVIAAMALLVKLLGAS